MLRLKLMESLLHRNTTNEWSWTSLKRHTDGLASWQNGLQVSSASDLPKWQHVIRSRDHFYSDSSFLVPDV